MKKISLSDIALPVGWTDRAQEAKVSVAAATADNRRAEINKRAAIWSELKEPLAILSFDTCWYCETRRSRSDFAVDHFRPKNRVSSLDSKDHPGYWWLAFDHTNYRYACTFCNSQRRDLETDDSGGKQDRFPIQNEANRARTPTDLISAETPTLLDPIAGGDPDLLFFEIDGRAVAAKEVGTIEHHRASISIQIYHLNQAKLKRSRKRLHSLIKQIVSEGDVYFEDGSHDQRVEHARLSIFSRVGEARRSDQEFTAAVGQFFSMFRSDANRPWLSVCLDEA